MFNILREESHRSMKYLLLAVALLLVLAQTEAQGSVYIFLSLQALLLSFGYLYCHIFKATAAMADTAVAIRVTEEADTVDIPAMVEDTRATVVVRLLENH